MMIFGVTQASPRSGLMTAHRPLVTEDEEFMVVPTWLVVLLEVLAVAGVVAIAVFLYLFRTRGFGRLRSNTDPNTDPNAGLNAGGDRTSRAQSLGQATDDASQQYVVFPPNVLPDQAAGQLLSSLVSAAVVVDFSGFVQFCSLEAAALKLTRLNRLDSEELEEIVAAVRGDGMSRTREIHFTAPGSPPLEKWLRVVVRKIGSERILVLADDVSAEHRFQQQRRDFITNVAHELKTPTGAIGLLAETIESATDDPTAVAYFAKRIGVESQRLGTLVARLIELEKVQNMSQMGEETDFDASPIVASTVEELKTTSEEHGVSVEVEAQPGLVLHGQENLLHSAVRNLVENAVHYSPQGSTVHVTAAFSQVSDSAHGEAARGESSGAGNEIGNGASSVARAAATATTGSGSEIGERTVIIRVVDQGSGIPQEAVPRIFERFYRVDSTRVSSTGGTGIGLSIVKHSVEGLGGKVSVWSREGEGSTFTLQIPAAGRGSGAGDPIPAGINDFLQEGSKQ